MNKVLHPLSACMCLALPASAVQAHGGDGLIGREDIWQAWHSPLWLSVLLLLAVGLYGRGLHRLRKRTGRFSSRLRWQACSYCAGIVVILIALVSPLDALAAMLSSAHMVQHMLLMVVAAPLLVLAAPLPVYLWGLPNAWRKRTINGTRIAPVSRSWQFLTAPLTAWFLHGVAVWIWHVPRFYQAALRDQLVHDIEHASFFISALLFWWAVLRSLGRSTASSGLAVLLVFTTFMHGGMLAGLMTFSSAPWYTDYIGRTEVFGLTPLADQQLAGLIMWVPAGITYLVAGLLIFLLWLNGMENKQSAHESHPVRT